MKNFFVDFRTFSKTTQFYTDIGNKMYTDEAPQNTPLPYSVWSFPYGIPEYDLNNDIQENMTAQLDIYAKGASDIMDLFDEADNSFNKVPFNITGYELVEFRRITQRRIKEDGVRRYIIEFSIKIGEE